MLKVSDSDEDRIRKIVEYDKDYLNMDKDRLVLYAVSYLDSEKIEATFDKIVATSFKLFPKKFSLIGFPELPDGRTIYYCVYNHCTLTNKWLIGNVQSAFRITDRGRYFLEETKKMLEGKIELTRPHRTIPRRKEAMFITSLKKSAAYRKFLQNRTQYITVSEIFDALRVPSSATEKADSHLSKYLEYANRVKETDVIRFLEFSRDKIKGEE